MRARAGIREPVARVVVVGLRHSCVVERASPALVLKVVRRGGYARWRRVHVRAAVDPAHERGAVARVRAAGLPRVRGDAEVVNEHHAAGGFVESQ